jgi:signal transduction histidine kinase/sensor domain CHASE-containing protein
MNHSIFNKKTNLISDKEHRNSTIFFAWISILILFILPPTFVYFTFLNDYKKLDLAQVIRDSERVNNVFNEIKVKVTEKVTDWGSWDEPYNALAESSGKSIETFAKINVTASVFEGLNMSYVAFVKPGTSHAEIYTYSENSLRKRKSEEFDFLSINHPLIKDSHDKLALDFVVIDGLPAVIGARPMLKSDGSGPVAGRIIFAKVLDENLQKSLSEQIKLKIYLTNDPPPSDIFEDEHLNAISFGKISFGDKMAITSIPIVSSNGTTLATLKAEIPREILVFGKDSGNKIIWIMVLMMTTLVAGGFALYRLSGARKGISELLKTNQRLKEHEDQMRALIDAVPGYVSWFDSSLCYLGVNEKLAKDFNCTPKEFVGKHIGWNSVQKRPALEEEVEALFKSSESVRQAHIKVFKGSEERRYLLCLEKYANGNAIVAIGTDVTAQWQAEQQSILDRAIASHTSRLSALGEMAAGLAHEVNNPLAVISGSIHTLSKHKDNPEQFAKRKETIERCIERISKIVNNLRKFSRTDDKREFKPASLAQLIEEALVIAGVRAKSSDVQINLDLDNTCDILCDGIEIEQVIVNLVNNASDAVHSLEQRWVAITLTGTQDQVVLRVKDSGNGIPPDVVEKLFQPFFTTKKVGEGTGLGLSIVKGILDRHQATIEVVSSEKNTCFEIRFKRYVNDSKVA